ncbi:hypothetical protein HQ520_01915 [bacterium]|nr:hypothetical protein [bacterium]
MSNKNAPEPEKDGRAKKGERVKTALTRECLPWVQQQLQEIGLFDRNIHSPERIVHARETAGDLGIPWDPVREDAPPNRADPVADVMERLSAIEYELALPVLSLDPPRGDPNEESVQALGAPDSDYLPWQGARCRYRSLCHEIADAREASVEEARSTAAAIAGGEDLEDWEGILSGKIESLEDSIKKFSHDLQVLRKMLSAFPGDQTSEDASGCSGNSGITAADDPSRGGTWHSRVSKSEKFLSSLVADKARLTRILENGRHALDRGVSDLEAELAEREPDLDTVDTLLSCRIDCGHLFWWQGTEIWRKRLFHFGGLIRREDSNRDLLRQVLWEGEFTVLANWVESKLPHSGNIEWHHLEVDPLWSDLAKSINQIADGHPVYEAFVICQPLKWRLRLIAHVARTHAQVMATIVVAFVKTRKSTQTPEQVSKGSRKARNLAEFYERPALEFYFDPEHFIEERREWKNAKDCWKAFVEFLRETRNMSEFPGPWEEGIDYPTMEQFRNWIKAPEKTSTRIKQ